jgi:DNA-binding MarR family transcriptional regulator
MRVTGDIPTAPPAAAGAAAVSPAAPQLDADAKELAGLIVRLIRQMRSPGGDFPVELQARMDEQGLARRHVATLITIAVHEPLTVGQLAEHLALSPATASQLVNQLDRAGLVVRREDQADRRRVIVALHPRDRELIMPLALRRLGAIEGALRTMPPAERAQFVAGWRSLVDTLEHTPEPHQVPFDEGLV